MKLQQYFEAQMSLLHLERRSREVAEERKQAQYTLRSQDDRLLNYQGSVRGFLDRVSGKREEKEASLRRDVKTAEAAMNALAREQEALEKRRTELTEVLSSLPSSEALRQGSEREWAQLEAKYCAEALAPLLEENHRALLAYRELMQGQRPEILSPQRQQEIYAEPNVWAEQCVPLLLRLKEAREILEESMEIGDYYRSPTAYLVNAAAMHNRRERVNQALDQVEAVQKLVRNFE